MSPMLDAQLTGKIDAWDIRADYWRFKNGQFGINPVRSYTTNIGMGSGTHCTEETARYDNDISLVKAESFFAAGIEPDEQLILSYKSVYAFKGCRLYHKVRDILGRNTPPACKRLIRTVLGCSCR